MLVSDQLTELKTFLSRINLKANYQPIMIKTLLEFNRPISKDVISNQLYLANTKANKRLSHFNNVPVYEVLLKHKIVNYNTDTKLFTLNFTLSDSSRLELIQICDKLINDYEAKA